MEIFTHKDDMALVAQMKNDNQMAFTQIYHRYNKLLYVVAYRYLKDEDRAQDVVQYTFAKLWQIRGELNINVSLKNFLFTMAKNHILNKIRGDKKHLMVDYEKAQMTLRSDNLIDELEKRDMKTHLYNTIDGLASPKKEICLMKIDEELSNKDIAHKLNITIDSVKAHYYVALKELRRKIKAALIILILFTLFL